MGLLAASYLRGGFVLTETNRATRVESASLCYGRVCIVGWEGKTRRRGRPVFARDRCVAEFYCPGKNVCQSCGAFIWVNLKRQLGGEPVDYPNNNMYR